MHIRENDKIWTINKFVRIKRKHTATTTTKNWEWIHPESMKKHCVLRKKWAKNSEMNVTQCAPKSKPGEKNFNLRNQLKSKMRMWGGGGELAFWSVCDMTLLNVIWENIYKTQILCETFWMKKNVLLFGRVPELKMRLCSMDNYFQAEYLQKPRGVIDEKKLHVFISMDRNFCRGKTRRLRQFPISKRHKRNSVTFILWSILLMHDTNIKCIWLAVQHLLTRYSVHIEHLNIVCKMRRSKKHYSKWIIISSLHEYFWIMPWRRFSGTNWTDWREKSHWWSDIVFLMPMPISIPTKRKDRCRMSISIIFTFSQPVF